MIYPVDWIYFAGITAGITADTGTFAATTVNAVRPGNGLHAVP